MVRSVRRFLCQFSVDQVLVNWMRLEPRLDPLRGSHCYADAERKLYSTQ